MSGEETSMRRKLHCQCFRTDAKALLKILITHDKFDSTWDSAIKDEAKKKNLRKILNSMK